LVGFSDEDLYRELALSTSERKIPTFQIHIDGAKEVMEKWAHSDAKVSY